MYGGNPGLICKLRLRSNVFSYCWGGVCCFVLFVELFESSWGYFLVGLLQFLWLCCFVGVVVGTI